MNTLSQKMTELAHMPRSPQPLSRAARKRFLDSLVRRANAGDVVAAAELVRLSLEQDRARPGATQAPAGSAAPG